MTIETIELNDAVGGVPNNPLPLVIYRGVIPAQTPDPAAWLERHFAANDWPAQWRYIIYNFTHSHSNCHELLGVYAGESRVQVLIPAGVGATAYRTGADTRHRSGQRRTGRHYHPMA